MPQPVVANVEELQRALDFPWEKAPVLLILPAPDELGIEVGVAGVADLLRVLLLLFQHGLKLCRRDILLASGAAMTRPRGHISKVAQALYMLGLILPPKAAA